MIAHFAGFPTPTSHLLDLALLMGSGGLCTAALLAAMVQFRCAPILYVLSLLLTGPATLLALALPAFWWTGFTPIIQGLLLTPLLVLPLTLPLRALPANWTLTAQELGASFSGRLALLWWPLLKKPALTSLVVALVFGIVQ